MILESALDESTPLSFSLDDLLRNIESQSGIEDPVQPLPSWVDEVERYVREPDFLPESLGDTTGMTDSSFQTTRMTHSEDLPERSGDMDTERMAQSGPPPPPPPSLPEARPEPTRPAEPVARAEPTRRSEPVEPEPVEVEPEWEAVAEEEAAPPATEAAPEPVAQPEEEPVHEDKPVPAPPPIRPQPVRQEVVPEIPAGMITVGTESDDPRVARLALNLTQGALELTAEATLLADGREIVAYAGEMPLEEVEQISALVADDWEAKANESRIRFITSPASGKDYMLYSRATAAGLTLSLVFAGNMPLRVIRRQSDRLMEALSAVPDTPAPGEITEDVLEDLEALAELEQQEIEITSQVQAITAAEEAAPVAVGPLTPYACVWLVRDPDDYLLSNEVAQAIVAGLDLQLSRAGWDIVTIDVHEDYVYLVAGAPGERSAEEIVADLKQLASEVAYGADPSFDPAELWDDSYFALLPGRELDISEIQRFINFARSR
jgi:hypothetical protein